MSARRTNKKKRLAITTLTSTISSSLLLLADGGVSAKARRAPQNWQKASGSPSSVLPQLAHVAIPREHFEICWVQVRITENPLPSFFEKPKGPSADPRRRANHAFRRFPAHATAVPESGAPLPPGRVASRANDPGPGARGQRGAAHHGPGRADTARASGGLVLVAGRVPGRVQVRLSLGGQSPPFPDLSVCRVREVRLSAAASCSPGSDRLR